MSLFKEVKISNNFRENTKQVKTKAIQAVGNKFFTQGCKCKFNSECKF